MRTLIISLVLLAAASANASAHLLLIQYNTTTFTTTYTTGSSLPAVNDLGTQFVLKDYVGSANAAGWGSNQLYGYTGSNYVNLNYTVVASDLNVFGFNGGIVNLQSSTSDPLFGLDTVGTQGSTNLVEGVARTVTPGTFDIVSSSNPSTVIGTYAVSVVPEPTSGILLAGAAGFFILRRRRRACA